ncbi:CGNR zinc finger domain-containing protein [Jiangella aurantiaca]|uniref:CGNR zinc finger domain-containing protein n=1 Tax=Jiangella aurantiaca TaxID=2530373 RepID=A0A4R4ZXV9_9ACTN|nr:CGNR zinc finger domain-containing protein [Jiangella aurantiaca]TDD63845.1 CGNR zinc finger domain-containing protein [Jiangella aurantiaca]
MVNAAQEAPGALESVRELLNSWLIPNDTRRPDDRFDAWAAAHAVPAVERDTVRALRDDLRAVVDGGDPDAVVNRWIERTGVRPRVGGGALGFQHDGGIAGDLLISVLAAVGDGTWRRLKTCPDCRWAFYDHTRNGSKRWCLMTAGGPGGRSCGSIAKVRAYRARQASVPGRGSAGAG